MSDRNDIRFIAHQEIDRHKWDACLDKADNGLVYAQSFYLDTMTLEWDALVMGEYELIMPLPRRKKWGIAYLFQPFLTPQLGVFGNNISIDTISAFLDSIPSYFKLWDISLNASNSALPAYAEQYVRKNYVLDLRVSYGELRSNYTSNIIRNIARAQKNGCVIKSGIPVDDIISICRIEYPKFTKVEDGVFNNIKKIYEHYLQLNMAKTYAVYSVDGKLLASCAFLFYRDRAYYWLVGNIPENRNFGASHFLIDQFIQDHAGKDMILDFEGSDQATIAEFYQRFGAQPEPYTTIYLQRLPFPFNYLKKKPAHYSRLEQEGNRIA